LIVFSNQSEQPEPRSAVRIGLVGCGRLAEFGYLPAFRRATGVTLIGVADINQSRCSQIAPGVPASATLQALVEASKPEGIIISTPTRCHIADAICAAHADIQALLEKPPAMNLKEAEALLGLSPSPRIAFNRRFDPDIARLRDRLPREGMIQVRLELHYRRKAWRPFDMHDDALLDLGPHLIDLARWLTYSEIRSARARSIQPHRAEFELELERGSAAIVCSINSPYRELVRMNDARGHEIETFTRGGLVSGILARFRPSRENPLVHSLVGQLEAFGRLVRDKNNEGPLAVASDGVAVMSAIEAVRQSALRGGRECSPTSRPGLSKVS
jgi:predicted dehydrogenase